MLRKESQWVGRALLLHSAAKQGISLLNVGSSTLAFRNQDQSYIHKFIFNPLLQDPRNSIIHQDLKANDGVDIVGDITDSSFVDSLVTLKFDTFLVSNLLEHVEDIPLTIKNLVHLTPINGSIFVTGPVDFPYHPDPIDNMFRPNRTELEGLFSDLRLVQYQEVRHWNQVTATRTSLLRQAKSTFRDIEHRSKLALESRAFQRNSSVSAFCAHFTKSEG